MTIMIMIMLLLLLLNDDDDPRLGLLLFDTISLHAELLLQST